MDQIPGLLGGRHETSSLPQEGMDASTWRAIASWSVGSVRGQCTVEGKLSSKMLRLELLGCAFPMVSWFMFVMISDKSMRTGEDAVAVKRERVERLLASEAKAEEEEEEAKRRRGEEAKGEKTLS